MYPSIALPRIHDRRRTLGILCAVSFFGQTMVNNVIDLVIQPTEWRFNQDLRSAIAYALDASNPWIVMAPRFYRSPYFGGGSWGGMFRLFAFSWWLVYVLIGVHLLQRSSRRFDELAGRISLKARPPGPSSIVCGESMLAGVAASAHT
jgi:hypothetical protein